MFTGLVEDLGTLRSVSRHGDGAVLDIAPARLPLAELALGDSVAVDGVCLTVRERGAGTFRVDASAETLARSTLGGLRAGARLHLERALRLGDRLGGHLVQGHVDGRVRLRRVQGQGAARDLEFACSPELLRGIVPKGSVALSGVSLTVNRVLSDGFGLTVVPHTLSVTLLGDLTLGAECNLETDVLGKYVLAALSGGARAAAPTWPGGPAAAAEPGAGGLGAALLRAGLWSGGGGE